MSPELRFSHPIQKLALATKPPPNNGFNLSLGVDALTTLGQSFFMWPFLPHQSTHPCLWAAYGPPIPSAFFFLVHCWVWAQTSRTHVCPFCTSCGLATSCCSCPHWLVSPRRQTFFCPPRHPPTFPPSG